MFYVCVCLSVCVCILSCLYVSLVSSVEQWAAIQIHLSFYIIYINIFIHIHLYFSKQFCKDTRKWVKGERERVFLRERDKTDREGTGREVDWRRKIGREENGKVFIFRQFLSIIPSDIFNIFSSRRAKLWSLLQVLFAINTKYVFQWQKLPVIFLDFQTFQTFNFDILYL